MDILILSIFAVVVILSFMEDYMLAWQKALILFAIGMALVCISTFKPMTTADATNYEVYFYNDGEAPLNVVTEPTYVYLSRLYLAMGFGITSIFLTYALIAIPIKLSLLWKLTPFIFTSMIVYVGIYYPMHDAVQIRCGVATAFLLWSIVPLQKRQYFRATFLYIIAILFHFSSLAFLPILLWGNKKINRTWKYALGASIPCCLLLYFAGYSIFSFVPEFLFQDKLSFYKEMSETGFLDSYVPHKQLTFMAEFCLLYVYLIFYDTIEEHCPYAPILVKTLVLSMGFHIMFSEIEVLGSRLHDLFGMFHVVAYVQCLYIVKPRYLVRLGITAFSLMYYLVQMHHGIYFH